MRYIGSKDNLLDFIEFTVRDSGITSGVFCDLFAGTTAVGRYFKNRGYSIISNDLMHFSFVFGKAYIEACEAPDYGGLGFISPPSLLHTDGCALQGVVDYLNSLAPVPGFMHEHYSDVGTKNLASQRMYLSADNAARIDSIRNQLAVWHSQGCISDAGFFLLLAALLEAVPGVSNISGTYGSYLKYWEARSQKRLTLEVPVIIPSACTHAVYAMDGNELVKTLRCNVLYLDPPYNARQYAPNYHILETIASWDAPTIYGKTGLRPYAAQRSQYCNGETALKALAEIARNAACDVLLLSYNSEGIMPDEDIRQVLSERGPLKVHHKSYRRYKSDSDNEKRTYKSHGNIIERIYAVRT